MIQTLFNSLFINRCIVFKTYLNFSVAQNKNSGSQQYIAVDRGPRAVCTLVYDLTLKYQSYAKFVVFI